VGLRKFGGVYGGRIFFGRFSATAKNPAAAEDQRLWPAAIATGKAAHTLQGNILHPHTTVEICPTRSLSPSVAGPIKILQGANGH